MGIFKRLQTITKANANKILDAMEGDGEAVMEQTIVDAKVDLAKQKRAAAEVVADYNRYKKEYDDIVAQAQKYHTYAGRALKAGNEEDAAKNLTLEKEKRAKAEEVKVKMDRAKQQADMAKANYNKIVEQISEAEDTMREVKRNNRVAGSAEMASTGVVSTDALARFDRLAEKSQARYDVAMALEDMDMNAVSEEDEMEAKYGSASDDVSSEMEELRREMGMGRDVM